MKYLQFSTHLSIVILQPCRSQIRSRSWSIRGNYTGHGWNAFVWPVSWVCNIGTNNHGVLFGSEPFLVVVTKSVVDATQFEIYLETSGDMSAFIRVENGIGDKPQIR